ncbi:MAG: lysophospholipid acyltransferase family protein [Acidobacteriaceae bacterium]
MSSFTRKEKILLAVVPPLAAALIRVVGATLRYRDVNALGVPVGHTLPGPVVFAFWHCSMLTCAHRFRNLGIAILISRSFDGELIARTVELLGFLAVRGSSSRGGAAGLKGMAEAYAAGHRCAFTADGPRGPERVAKAGPVQLAQLTGATWIGAYHAEADRAWYLKSWDRFAIPKPFSTVTFGWPAHVGLELELVQRALDEAVAMAEDRVQGSEPRVKG